MDQVEEYEMWHDEYKCPNSGAYVHGILLIPCNRKKEIIEILGDLRKEFDYGKDIKCGFAGSLGSNKKSQLLRNQLLLASHFIKTKRTDSVGLCHVDGRMKYTRKYKPFMKVLGNKPFRLKAGLLIVPDNHSEMFGIDYSAKVETTLRFGFKGLCHWAFNNQRPITIKKLFFDGYEHHKRGIDINKIIGRKEWNKYVEINPEEVEIDDRHRKDREDSSALIMDLVDSMVGGK